MKHTLTKHTLMAALLGLTTLTGMMATADVTWNRHDIAVGYFRDPTASAIKDMDGDGDMDLVTGATWFGAGALSWWENDGAQGFTEHLLSSDGNFWNVLALDMDKDGDMDIVARRDHEDSHSILTLYLNDPAGGFTPVDVYDRSADGRTGDIHRPVIQDLDGDGDLDMASAMGVPGGGYILFWLENVGANNFIEHVINRDKSETINSVAVGDMDKDGDPDLATSHSGGATLEPRVNLWLNPGNMKLAPMQVLGGFVRPHAPYQLAQADVDLDGDADLLLQTTHWGVEGRFSWLENDGALNFSEHVLANDLLDVGGGNFAVDLDRDGDMDLLHDQYTQPGRIRWFENDGLQAFSERLIVTDFSGAHMAPPADLDGDGDVDVVGTAFFMDTIAWWENMLETGVGGSVTALAPWAVRCINHSTGQRIDIALPEDTVAWDCEAAGLNVGPGDEIAITVRGTAR